jgi:PTS system fructose-specific IIC component
MPRPEANSLLILGVILVTGTLCGALARRLRLPAITGQILGGMLIGESGLALFPAEAIEGLQPITYFALGLVAVSVGGHLNFQRMRNAGRRLLLLVLAEATITPALVLLAVVATGHPLSVAILLAAIAISTAPATIVALIKETRARGVFVTTLLGGVALNNMACIAVFAICRIAARMTIDPASEHSAGDLVVAPLRQLLYSGLLGGVSGLALVAVGRRIVQAERLATASLVAILMTCGVAIYLGVSLLLAALFLGVAVANIAPEKADLGVLPFADFESAILAVFFTLAGMHLHVGHLASASFVVTLTFAARLAGKAVAGQVAMSLAGATSRVRRYLGMSLLPQAGVAVGLIVLVQEDPSLAAVHDLFLTVGLGVVVLNEIVGPILTKAALERSGDAGKDRARLLDFIREEHIVTDLKASSMKEAIEQLTDWMIQTHNLRVDRGRLLRSILRREAEMSTCVGSGLAVPHGELEEGSEMVGVVGLNRSGLPFDTPDGAPVHCIVLLATPATQQARHLEVLAALARKLGADSHLRSQLFNARSAAHAFEVLHAERAEDFNYFLDQRD